MPFDNNALVPLLTNSGFTLWFYRTQDSRAAALSAGYFSSTTRLAAGDVIFLQAADSLTLTTVRTGTAVADGLVVDVFDAPFRVERGSAQRFSVRQMASAVAMTVLLAPLAGGLIAGAPMQAQAAVAGPVGQVSFSISDASGATVEAPEAVAVSSGSAKASLTAPPEGSGYRLRVEAVGNPQVADTSPPFAVSAPYALLEQDGDTIVAQDGSRLLI
jgi:hypothetical protein